MLFHFLNFSQCVCLGIKISTKLQISKSTPNRDISFLKNPPAGRELMELIKLFANHNALGQLTNHNTFSFSEGGASSNPELIE